MSGRHYCIITRAERARLNPKKCDGSLVWRQRAAVIGATFVPGGSPHAPRGRSRCALTTFVASSTPCDLRELYRAIFPRAPMWASRASCITTMVRRPHYVKHRGRRLRSRPRQQARMANVGSGASLIRPDVLRTKDHVAARNEIEARAEGDADQRGELRWHSGNVTEHK